jgi:hypothetical protein
MEAFMSPHALARTARTVSLVVLVIGSIPAAAQPLQVDASLRLRTATAEARRVVVPIEPGAATLAITAHNRRGDAVLVDLVFRYRIPPDSIAFDEVIDRIELSAETPQGDVFSRATIDADEVPLNPNRVPLAYRITLYHPTESPTYRVRVRVFGNYE